MIEKRKLTEEIIPTKKKKIDYRTTGRQKRAKHSDEDHMASCKQTYRGEGGGLGGEGGE